MNGQISDLGVGKPPVVTGDHDNLDTSCMTLCNSLFGFRTRRIYNSDESQKNAILSILLLLVYTQGQLPFFASSRRLSRSFFT
jgi:hypothetical protein